MLTWPKSAARSLPKGHKARSSSAFQQLQNQRGQALVEFLMIIPIVMMLLWYMIHIGMVINKSIVGQQAARSQLFLKLYNHRSGPVATEFGSSERSHFYIGVSSEITRGQTKPKAPVETLGIGAEPKLLPGSNDDPGEASANSNRQRIRVRTIFGICTHRKKNKDGVGLTDFCGTDPSM